MSGLRSNSMFNRETRAVAHGHGLGRNEIAVLRLLICIVKCYRINQVSRLGRRGVREFDHLIECQNDVIYLLRFSVYDNVELCWVVHCSMSYCDPKSDPPRGAASSRQCD